MHDGKCEDVLKYKMSYRMKSLKAIYVKKLCFYQTDLETSFRWQRKTKAQSSLKARINLMVTKLTEWPLIISE